MVNDRTLCFLLRGDPPGEVLLGFKKTGFGAGKYGGFGGKVEAGETIVTAALRELAEEAGVQADLGNLWRLGHLTFLFPTNPAWSQVVHVFVATAWTGVPAESDEMAPAWFSLNAIPYEKMWQDARHWLPQVLAGEPVRAVYTFAADGETVAKIARA